jgi:GNAT superfamily N-acetyltransferase
VSITKVVDVAGVELWHDVEERSVPFDHLGLVADPLEETLSLFRKDQPTERIVMFTAHDGDEVVGNEMIRYPLLDNLDNALVHLTVVPERRRRGIGRVMAAHLLDVVRAEGRRRAMGWVASPFDAEGPGLTFALGLGVTRANENVRRELDLEGLSDSTLDSVKRDLIGNRADRFQLVTWIDRAPDQLVETAARLMGRMSTDAPQGDSAWEPEAWDAARYREGEVAASSRRQRRFVAGAVDPKSGGLVAYTDIGVSTIRPEIAYQWDTVVDPDHRGHRLGLAIKAENLRQLRRECTASKRIETWNATSNSLMIAVNDALGFRPVERTTAVELAL